MLCNFYRLGAEMNKTSLANCLALMAVSLSSTTLKAQTLGAVEQRIARLEQSVRALQSQRIDRHGEHQPSSNQVPTSSAPQEALVSLASRLANLEQQLSGFVAAQEQDRRALTAQIDRLERLKGDAESRLEGLEQQVTALANAPKPAPVEAAPAKVQSPDDRYLEALGFAERSEWTKAEFAFDTFIANNPAHPRLIEARYWLGRSFLGQAKAAQAAQVFLELFEKHPDASIAVDNLFSLAEALAALGPENSAQVCAVYDQIETGYAAKLATTERNRILDQRVKQNCK